jgi:hypothetical protein
MLEKVKGALKYIVLPLTVLFGFIYYLLTQISSLKSQLARSKTEKELIQTLGALEEAKANADNAEEKFRDDLGDYERARSEYDASKRDVPNDTR